MIVHVDLQLPCTSIDLQKSEQKCQLKCPQSTIIVHFDVDFNFFRVNRGLSQFYSG
jgi:hypothetical protein